MSEQNSLLDVATTPQDAALSFIAAFKLALPEREFATFFEVSNAAGFARSRSADAISMSLWPSRGLEVTGFEFKESRSDWLRELKNPAKAESIAQYCDRWILYAVDGAAKPDEIPVGWGHWVWKNGKVRVAKAAPRQERVAPLDRSFVACVLRRASEADERIVTAALAKLRREDEARVEKRIEYGLQNRRNEYADLKKVVDEFMACSGIELGRHTWSAGKIGKAVKLILEMGEEDAISIVRNMHRRIGDATTAFDAGAEKKTATEVAASTER